MQKILCLVPAFVTVIGLLSCSTDRFADRLFRDYTGQKVPGAAVMIIDHGAILFQKGYGMADLERQIPVSSATNFRLASVSKQFTAMAIMKLVESGKLSYAETLANIFPEFPEYGEVITIEYLLQHRSGLIDYEDLIPDTATIPVRDSDVLQMMMTVDSTYFVPGTEYRYSNSGYAVLAMIVEEKTGKRYAEFLEDEIFHPLRMLNTVAYEKGISSVPNRAFGYHVETDSVVFSDQSITSAVLGDGGIYSSLNDLFMWDQALYTETLVSRESLTRAFTPMLENYGFGWRIDEYLGHRRLHHTGSTCGFRNVIQRFPDDQFTVIILTNRREPEVADLADKLVRRFLL
ncbi:MAG: serine hydrolase domain-containing protein [Fidelibacterota bacterium]